MVALTGTTTTTSSEFVPLSLNWKIRVRVLTGPEGGPSRGWPTPGPKSSKHPQGRHMTTLGQSHCCSRTQPCSDGWLCARAGGFGS
jgi:hypothetical protein